MLYNDMPLLALLAGILALCRDADDVKLHRVLLRGMLAQAPPLEAPARFAGMRALSHPAAAWQELLVDPLPLCAEMPMTSCCARGSCASVVGHHLWHAKSWLQLPNILTLRICK